MRSEDTTGPSRLSVSGLPLSLLLPLLLACSLSLTGAPSHAAVIYVKSGFTIYPPPDGTSWRTAWRGIAQSIVTAQAGDEIWVAAGPYGEPITLKEGVSLYGGFAGTETTREARDPAANVTRIDGSMRGALVTAPPGITPATVLDGFTISGGGSFPHNTPQASGGGLVCQDASPTIANNTFQSNWAAYGSAIYCVGTSAPRIHRNTMLQNLASRGGTVYCAAGSAPVIQDNVITGVISASSGATSSGSGIVCVGASAVIERNVITASQPATTPAGGTAVPPGGAISCQDASPVIRDNDLRGNHGRAKGGAVYCLGGAPTITGNRITGNTAGSGGAIFCEGTQAIIANNFLARNSGTGDSGALHLAGGAPVVRDNVLTGNTAPATGAIFCDTDAAVIVNNTIVANSGGTSSIRLTGGVPVIANNILAHNRGAILPATASPAIHHNCFYGNLPTGESPPPGPDEHGNLYTDPILARPMEGGLHIQPGSPCVDAGDAAAVPDGATDMDGQARFQGAGVDIGADESDGSAWIIPARVVRVSPTGDDASDGGTWGTAKRHIQAALDAVHAAGGGTVWVAGGRYPEAVTIGTLCRLQGGFAGSEESPAERHQAIGKAMIDGQPVTVRDGALNVAFDRLTVRNGRVDVGARAQATLTDNRLFDDRFDQPASGIYCYGASIITATGNSIRANYSGISCQDTTSALVANNRIVGCSSTGISVSGTLATVVNNVVAANGSTGIRAWNTRGLIANNTISGNGFTLAAGTRGGGIDHYAYGEQGLLEIVNNIVEHNISGVAVSLQNGAAPPVLRNNCLFDNAQFAALGIADPSGTDGNIAVDPGFLGLDVLDLRLAPDSPCVDTGDDGAVPAGSTDIEGQPRIQGTRVDIGADESDGSETPLLPIVIRVRADGDDASDGLSWGTARRSVMGAVRALVAAGVAGEVWVASGVYPERLRLGDHMGLYGGFAGHETERAERDWRSNTSVLDGQGVGTVIRMDHGGANSTVDGFTIRNGKGDDNGGGTTSAGGILCHECQATIANNTITDCQADWGGGIAAWGGTGRIVGNVIRGNTAKMYGGGIGTHRAAPLLAGNLVVDNVGGGLSCTLDAAPQVVNNTFSGNGSGAWGGAIALFNEAHPAFVNNIVVFNASGLSRDAAHTGAVTLRRNDVFGNAAYNFDGLPDPTGTDGNIAADPLFADRTAGDYRLAAGSPGIDAGENAAWPAGLTDLDGRPRPIGARVDLGAYESPAGTDGTWEDVRRILQVSGGLRAPEPADPSRFDTQAPGGLDMGDATAALRRVLGFH